MKRPLISVCLPSLNTRPFLEERMETILAQSVTDWELIICDSYSNDGSWEFFQELKRDSRIRIYQVQREGLYAGWNECLARACGEYVYFAAADDTMLPTCLERLVAPLERRPELHIAVCDFQEIDADGRNRPKEARAKDRLFGPWMHTPSIRSGATEFLVHAGFGTTVWGTMSSVLFRKSLLKKTGFFRTDLGSRADEEWTLRASLASDIAFVPGRLATWRVHPGQATGHWTNRHEAAGWLVEAIQSVLYDATAGIPDEWRRVPDWMRRLTEAHRTELERSFHLYRWKARAEPWAFLRDYAVSWRCAPRWAVSQTLNGFRWEEPGVDDAIARTELLLREFSAKWPPTAMDWSS